MSGTLGGEPAAVGGRAAGGRLAGQIKNGKIHGHGVATYANGCCTYDGQWQGGKEHGRGVETYASTCTYYLRLEPMILL